LRTHGQRAPSSSITEVADSPPPLHQPEAMKHLKQYHLSIVLAFLWATAATSAADQFGPFFYSVNGDTVEITG
jgi:hypothetical protein